MAAACRCVRPHCVHLCVGSQPQQAHVYVCVSPLPSLITKSSPAGVLHICHITLLILTSFPSSSFLIRLSIAVYSTPFSWVMAHTAMTPPPCVSMKPAMCTYYASSTRIPMFREFSKSAQLRHAGSHPCVHMSPCAYVLSHCLCATATHVSLQDC